MNWQRMGRRLCVLCGLVVGATGAAAGPVDLTVKGFKHITFDDIPATAYTNEGGVLQAVVAKSSSFLLMPFDKIRPVQKVSFAWHSTGGLKVKSAAEEEEKGGDDSLFRVGLVISGEAPSMVSWMLPSWIKAIREAMVLPTNKLLYLVVGAKHPAGSTWESPYSDSMRLVSVASTDGKEGWKDVRHDLGKKGEQVVGIWLMADGDNTDSSFTTKIRDLNLE